MSLSSVIINIILHMVAHLLSQHNSVFNFSIDTIHRLYEGYRESIMKHIKCHSFVIEVLKTFRVPTNNY